MNEMNEKGADRVAYLVAGYIRQTLSEKEHDELDEWITANDDNQRLFEELTDPVIIQEGLEKFGAPDADLALHRIKNKIQFKEPKGTRAKRKWMPYGVAASVILLAGIIFLQVMNKKRKADNILAKTNKIQPGGNFATLTLGDGKTINLFASKKGLIDSSQGNEVLKTSDDQISYIGPVTSNAYHILRTPAGGQYSVMLPDSTRVWLNSSSSLQYPVSFLEKERVVELTGEGYFEVAKITSRSEGETSPGLKATPSEGGERRVPFIVKVGNMQVEVLGTHFNINAYSDEPMIRTALLEGKVIVRGQEPGVGSRELVPGEQAMLMKNGEWKIENAVDVEEVIAWKNGMFLFRDSEIENVMRQIGRWYNAEIVYEGKVDHHFNATLYRKEPIDKLLHFLEETNEVHFKVEGRKIVVRP